MLEVYNTKITKNSRHIKMSDTSNLNVLEFDELGKILQKLVIADNDTLEQRNEKNKILSKTKESNQHLISDASICDSNISISVVEREQDLSKRNICSFSFLESHYSILSILILNNNKIENVEWEKLPVTLKELNLSHNFIKDVGSIRNLFNLVEIKLNNNKITNINADFNQLGDLKVIDLSNNELSKLPEGFELIDVDDLSLNLSSNNFTYEDDDTFTTIQKNLWNRLPKTSRLSLNKNRLSELPCQLAGKIKKIEAMDCNIKYICPQIYQILFDPEYISKNRRKQRIYLNIAKNDDLKTSTFIPHSIWPIARASEVPNDEHLYDLEYDGFGMLVHTKESAIYSTIVSNTKTLNKTEKRKVVYDFKGVEESVEELKTICKCCGYCSPKNAKIHETVMIEQLMMMGCTFVVAKDELLEKSPFFINRPGWHAGKWKAIIRTRMCEICKEYLKKTAQTANDLYESYIKNEKEEKKSIEQKRLRLDENDVIDGTRPPQELQPLALTMNTYSDPQTSVNVPQQITIILHYSYPTEKFLREKCEIFNIPFQKYPFLGCESSYNSSIYNSIPIYYGKIERDEYSGYKALSLLLTGSVESYYLIRNTLCNYLYLSNLNQRFYTIYSESLSIPTISLRECDIYAIANMFEINIFVFNYKNDMEWFLINESRFDFTNDITQFIYQRPTILLYKTSDGYFDAVLGISRKPPENRTIKLDMLNLRNRFNTKK